MGKFTERGRAKAEARAARGARITRARFARKLEAVKLSFWQRLAAKLDEGTRERLLEFCSDAPTVEQGVRVLLMVSRWALRQADPAAAINQQLNEAEKAEDARPKIDPAWLPSKATEGKAPEAAQENA